VPALERLNGLRVVADPGALDAARWSGALTPAGAPVGEITVLRFSSDEAFAIGARHVDIDDADALVVEEAGFVGAWCDLDELWPHLEWPAPDSGPALAQGSIAGVPAKIWSPDDEDYVLLLTAAAYAYELEVRLGWRT
jgi:hypothetical protein